MTAIIRFLVNNNHFSILLMLIILVYGLSSLYNIQLKQDPELDIPVIEMTFTLHGASPEEMEKKVAFLIENEIRSDAEIKTINTSIFAGRVFITLVFQHGINTQLKEQQITSKINNIRRRLPRLLNYSIHPYVISDTISAFLFAIDNDSQNQQEIKRVALDFISLLEGINTLKNIELIQVEKDIVISVNVIAMQDSGITIDQVFRAVESHNHYSASSNILIKNKDFRLQGDQNNYRAMADIAQTPLLTGAGTMIKLSDIASITKKPRYKPLITQVDGNPVLLIKAGVQKNVNLISVKNTIDQQLIQFNQLQKADAQIHWIFDQSESVKTVVFGLLDSFFIGLMILLVVLVFSVGFRSALMIGSILPFSFLTAIILFSFTGYGIQQVSIAGFIIALGLIVDNGIVITENAYLLQRYQGFNKTKAAIAGTSSAISPLFSSTITTMLAFTPIFFISTDVGDYLRSMTLSIWFSLAASLVIAVTVITLFISEFGTLGKLGPLPNPPNFLIKLIPFRDRYYKKILTYCIRWRWLTITCFVSILVLTLSLSNRLSVELFPPSGEPYLTVNVTIPPGTTAKTREYIAEQIEKKLSPLNDIAAIILISGSQFPQLSVVMNNFGDIVILVKAKFSDAKKLKGLKSKIQTALISLQPYTDIRVNLFQYSGLFNEAPFILALSSNKVDSLKTYAKKIDTILRQVEGVELLKNPVKSSQLAVQINLNNSSMAHYGITKDQLDPILDTLTYGREVTRFHSDQGDEFPILVKIEPSLQTHDDAGNNSNPFSYFRKILIPTGDEGEVPLSELIQISFHESEQNISHIQYKPTVEIEIWNNQDYSPEQVAKKILAVLNKTEKPDTITVKIGGQLNNTHDDFAGLGKNALLSIALIFTVFVLQFKSFSQPFIIFSVIPLCLIGAISGLLITGSNLTFLAAVGITSLVGIVVNDSILLVDEGNRLAKNNPQMSITDIAVKAGCKRFMPVLLTSVTTIASIMPLVLTEGIFQEMAITIVAGLATSTVLLYLLVPVLYSFLSKNKNINNSIETK